ncbi:hypothetical protein IWQ47_004656 [Aquimarina sp. EL_43]|uniref:hypothetical protein n=1 Tax=unclassified Aquimarina TaxID=2627091 RepID=UPI0018CA5043|nr:MULTISPECIES: hypothetical protein [unclassified Aquimarina]MBG6133248.1 hypothetical protein [Aquimarina sp. EL_35]MBG6153393.1 hypothetical protein [Aquimarina sp. EL_32]MBG6171562.1 hypothetical protein [Aquimarina sp. EL_43]
MKLHSFHIPVMGIGFTIDTPLKVSHLGIDSVISLVDDILLEKLRKMYCDTFEIPYNEITESIEDFRAKRITSYLNLMNDLAERKFNQLKNITTECSNELRQYFNILPDTSALKQRFKNLTSHDFNGIKDLIETNLSMGSIDVNIMTKVDKENYQKKEKLSSKYNDAHAALRGYANSDLSSSVILSAGMNPRLYSYMEEFEDFYPNENGEIKKKIVLKVSDYRSALIQGKFLAKKGLWVSEYRIESGLNCGGHAFATDGYLLGPILAQFRDQKEELISEIHKIIAEVLSRKNRHVPQSPLPVKITAQGGVGTAEEHQFLLEHYKVDSVGWGTPFLLVPEATTVDNNTLDKLVKAKEDDLYLSDISPLGIPFNSLKGNTKDQEKLSLVEKNRPGSSCPKKYVALNKEFTEKGICTASRQYQHIKIKELDKKELSREDYQREFDQIIQKSCTCVGLGTSALLKYNLDTKVEGEGVSICPGPNMAYFSKIMSLKEITSHIYGESDEVVRADRPNMFIKELNIYIDYLKDKLEETRHSINNKQKKYLSVFVKNLKEGVSYYENIFGSIKIAFESSKSQILNDLDNSKVTLNEINSEIDDL